MASWSRSIFRLGSRLVLVVVIRGGLNMIIGGVLSRPLKTKVLITLLIVLVIMEG